VLLTKRKALRSGKLSPLGVDSEGDAQPRLCNILLKK
jgi:hypothetical protein